jgi:hypothetical protein
MSSQKFGLDKSSHRVRWRFSLKVRASSTMNLFQKVNEEMYIKILSQDVVRRKNMEKQP